MRIRKRFNFPKVALSKRGKFVAATLSLSLGLFISQLFSSQERIIPVLGLATLSSVLLLTILYEDLKGNLSPAWIGLFILPFFYTLSFGLFYFLLPARFLTRISLTTLFAVGLYALYLSHNIYAVAGIRTIQLLKAAHSVAFLLTVLTYFFLINIIFSLHLIPPVIFLLIFLLNLILIFPCFWSVNLETKITRSVLSFTLVLSLVLSELGLVLNFWPATPTVAALFLAGNFYTFVGLSQAWLERRLFKNTLWEYLGVAVIVLLVLITRTRWGG